MNHKDAKTFPSLQVSDLEQNPIWEFIYEDSDEVSVFPVCELPVSTLSGRLVGTRVRLGNGNLVWAMIMYLDANRPHKNQHYITLLIENGNQWFTLSRYWDEDYSRNGPEALAQFLGLSIYEVFPIDYDVRDYVVGDPAALVGTVSMEPKERLSEEEIIRMAIP